MSCLVEEAPVAATGRDEAPSAGVPIDEASAWERFRREQVKGRTWAMRRRWRDEEGL